MEIAILVGAAALAVAAFALERRRRRREERDLARLVGREPRLTPTARPLGLDAVQLASRSACLPSGDRNCGVEHGVQGPLSVRLAGEDAELDAAALRWWWEQRRQTNRHVRYVRRRTAVAMARLPWVVPLAITVTEESVLGRIGLTRGGQQLESSEFNRRFRVEGADERLTLMLLDADVQRLLLEEFGGRSVEIVGDLVVLTGTPAHRDGTLSGFVGELPALRQDLQRLLGAVPAGFWRALGQGAGVESTGRGHERERPHG